MREKAVLQDNNKGQMSAWWLWVAETWGRGAGGGDWRGGSLQSERRGGEECWLWSRSEQVHISAALLLPVVGMAFSKAHRLSNGLPRVVATLPGTGRVPHVLAVMTVIMRPQ